MLYTNLKHIENAHQYHKVVQENEHVVVACGKMDPASVNLYSALEKIRKRYQKVTFYDFEFDHPETQSVGYDTFLTSCPAVVFIQNGEICRITHGEQTVEQLASHLKECFHN